MKCACFALTTMACSESITEVEIDKILPSLFKLRQLDMAVVDELTKSMATNGLLQPIIVKPFDGVKFRLVLGSHRLEAARRLGWKNVSAIVKRVTDEESLAMSMTENMQRNIYMSPVAEAKAYEFLLSKNWTIREISSRIGKSDSYVCNRMRILRRLHPEILKQMEFPRGNSPISVSHAEHLSTIDDPLHQLELADLIRSRKLTLHELERMTRKKTKVTNASCLCRRCSNYMCIMHRHTKNRLKEADVNKSLLKRYFDDAINKRKFSLFDKFCSKDYLWHIFVWSGEEGLVTRSDVKGVHNLKRKMMQLLGTAPDLKVELEEIIAEGERVAARYAKIFTDPKGARKVRDSMSIFRVENGLLSEEWQIEETSNIPVL